VRKKNYSEHRGNGSQPNLILADDLLAIPGITQFANRFWHKACLKAVAITFRFCRHRPLLNEAKHVRMWFTREILPFLGKEDKRKIAEHAILDGDYEIMTQFDSVPEMRWWVLKKPPTASLLLFLHTHGSPWTAHEFYLLACQYRVPELFDHISPRDQSWVRSRYFGYDFTMCHEVVSAGGSVTCWWSPENRLRDILLKPHPIYS
jgi:hypothetical protein